jgi:quercetin dioxygenase-like cupin family protein
MAPVKANGGSPATRSPPGCASLRRSQLAGGTYPGPVVPDDALEAAPMQYRLEAETDRLRVIRVRYEPGERSPQHRHPALPHVVVNLTNGLLRLHLPDGTARDLDRRAGAAVIGSAEETVHALENVGAAPFEALRIEVLPPQT